VDTAHFLSARLFSRPYSEMAKSPYSNGRCHAVEIQMDFSQHAEVLINREVSINK
jgi:hypothetical protein